MNIRPPKDGKVHPENLTRHVPQSAYDTGRLVRSIGSHVVGIQFLGESKVENFHVASDVKCAVLGFLHFGAGRRRGKYMDKK